MATSGTASNAVEGSAELGVVVRGVPLHEVWVEDVGEVSQYDVGLDDPGGKDDALKQNPRYANLSAFQHGNVWNPSKRTAPDTGNDFWQSGMSQKSALEPYLKTTSASVGVAPLPLTAWAMTSEAPASVMNLIMLLNKEGAATKSFDSIAERYAEVAKKAKNAADKPSVLVGQETKGQWYVLSSTRPELAGWTRGSRGLAAPGCRRTAPA
jgi:hypothetical protein